MALKGSQFDLQRVSPIMDASLFGGMLMDSSFIFKDRGSEFSVSVETGRMLNIGTGAATIQGRYVQNTETKQYSVPSNFNGYIAICIDLTKDNTEEANEQLYFDLVTSLTQTNLNNGGTIYQFPLAKVTSDATSITSIEDMRTFMKGEIAGVKFCYQLGDVLIQGDSLRTSKSIASGSTNDVTGNFAKEYEYYPIVIPIKCNSNHIVPSIAGTSTTTVTIRESAFASIGTGERVYRYVAIGKAKRND